MRYLSSSGGYHTCLRHLESHRSENKIIFDQKCKKIKRSSRLLKNLRKNDVGKNKTKWKGNGWRWAETLVNLLVNSCGQLAYLADFSRRCKFSLLPPLSTSHFPAYTQNIIVLQCFAANNNNNPKSKLLLIKASATKFTELCFQFHCLTNSKRTSAASLR